MARNIDYYFSMASPWAYIGHVPFMEMARRHDAMVTFKPVSLGNVFVETGGLPFAKRHPARQRYRILELQRWREKRRLKFNLHPQFWPLNAELADRFVVAVIVAGHDPDPFLRSAFAAVWEGEQNLADEGTLIGIADDVKLPGATLWLTRNATRARPNTSKTSKTPSRSRSSVRRAMCSMARCFGARIGSIS